MITRDNVLSQAITQCMKELYSLVQPSVDWEEFIKESRIYSAAYNVWEEYIKLYNNRDKNPEKWNSIKEKHPDWEEKSITECIGPRPYEFYYLPGEVMKDICNSYISAYRLDSQQELLNTIEILKHYCREPIVDKYIEDYTDEYGNYHHGYRGYDHPDNLEKEVKDTIYSYLEDEDLLEIGLNELSKELQDKFFKFLDMAGNFYNWNRDLNTFNTNVYLGSSPSSNKKSVIENWKKYRKIDVKIDEEQIKKKYYGEDYD